MTSTPLPEQDKVEKYRSLIMNKHSNEWDMEKVSTVAHLCPDTEPIARKIANCYNYACTTCPDDAIEIAELITAYTNKQIEEVLDSLDRRVGGLEIDVEMTMRQIKLLEISDDELARHSLNLQIEADDRKAVLDDILSAIEAERARLRGSDD